MSGIKSIRTALRIRNPASLFASRMRFRSPLSLLCAIAFLACGFCAKVRAQESDSQSRGLQPVTAPESSNNAWRDHRDYALLFATDNYDSWPTLVNPIPDAHAIADELRNNYGFETEVIEDATHDKIVSTLREYGKRKYGQGDQLFIFFAGHGVYDDVFKQGYIVAKDSRMDDTNRLSYESYDDLRQIINSIPAKHIMLVVDACFSGTLDQRIGQASSRGAESYAKFSIEEIFDKKAELSTRKYLTSGGKEYVPDGLPGHHSPFASRLLDVLRTYGGSQGYLTFAGIAAGVENTKPQPFWGQWGDDDPGSEFLFVPKRPEAKSPESAESSASGPAEDSMRSAPTESRRPSIAVLGFENVSNRPEEAWLSNAISEELRTDLAAGEKLRSISGENVARAKTDLSLSDASGFAADTLTKIYDNLGSDYVVTGSYMPLDTSAEGKIRVELRLQNAKTGVMIDEAADSGTVSDLADLVTKLGGRLRDKLGIPDPSPIQADNARATAPSNEEASRDYIDGLTKLRSYDVLGARDSLDRAVAADPKFALAHEALAEAWADLGYDEKATDEAKTAFNLDKDLSFENQRAIEGRYRQMTAEWDRAIEIYHSLWTVYPDETEYALKLAEVQSAAGKGNDALATLKQLRDSDPSAGSDPRIDYESAIAAESISDAEQEHTFAAAAADKADKQGSRLLAAQSYWQDCNALFLLGNLNQAEGECRKANAAADDTGQPDIKARSMTALSRILAAEGHINEAMMQRQAILQSVSEIVSKKDMIGALLNLADLEAEQGHAEDAQRDDLKAIDIAREIDDKQQTFDLENNLAADSQTRGDFVQAKASFEDALKTARDSNDQGSIAIALQNLGSLLLETGDLAGAEIDIRAGLAISQKANLKSTTASGLSNLGDIQMVKDQLQDAGHSYEQELRLFTEIGDKANIAGAQLSIAKLALEQRNPDEAERLARQAVAEFQAEKSIDNEGDALNTLARALMLDGNYGRTAQGSNGKC
jgi:tetratricopeptide (TPR) repeat protein